MWLAGGSVWPEVVEGRVAGLVGGAAGGPGPHVAGEEGPVGIGLAGALLRLPTSPRPRLPG